MRHLTAAEAIDILITSCCKQSLEWTWQAAPGSQPIFHVTTDGEYLGIVNLRDYPQFFEELPDRVFTLTAAARKRYTSLPRP